MDRITFIEIAGYKYPLSFSLGAAKELIKKFGSLEKMSKELSLLSKMDDKTIDALSFILEVMIKQGCAYLNVFGKDLPVEKGACYKEGYVSLNQEEIEIGVGLLGINKVAEAISRCMSQSSVKEVETESKNVRAPKAG